MKTKIVIIAALALTAMACNTMKMTNNDTAQNQKALIGPSWNLAKLDGKAISNPDNNTEKIHFAMKADNNRVGGFAGCNNFMGSYTFEGNNRINFSPMASTRKACHGLEVNESEVLKVFDQADSYKIKGDQLMLNDDKGKTLAVFNKAEETVPEITEKYWKLKTLEGKDVKMAKNQEKEQYFMLKNDSNRVKGFSGCNTFSGEFTLEKEKKRIHFSKMASTMRACPDVDVDESAFLKVFSQADNYRINGDTLELNVGRRAPLAVFEAVYF